MSDDKKSSFLGLGLTGVFIFLAFCNLYQPNAAIAALSLSTVFLSLLWTLLIEIGIIVIISIGILILLD